VQFFDTTTGQSSILPVGAIPNYGTTANKVNHQYRAVTEAWLGPSPNSSCAELPQGNITFYNVRV
jgi:hypothetical protein